MSGYLDQSTKTLDESAERIHLLYPLFKEEVFRRRSHMIGLTGIACTVLVGVLVLFSLFPPEHFLGSSYRWISISGIMVYSTSFAYFILQHADRHRMAKHQLIQLEQEWGLYQPSTPDKDTSLYPQAWQTDWASDRSVVIYLCCLSSLTVLVICTLLISV